MSRDHLTREGASGDAAPFPLDRTSLVVHSTAAVCGGNPVAATAQTGQDNMGKGSLRADVYKAALTVLSGMGNANELAEGIVDEFTNIRSKVDASVQVSTEVKRRIEQDLTDGGYSYAGLRDKHGVGISTVQRVAAEMRAKGKAVRTAGQTIPA